MPSPSISAPRAAPASLTLGLSLSQMTRMVCTLGPSCWSVEGLGALIDAGMTMARFNFSHGDHDAHGASLARLREAASARPGCQVSAMLDTKGMA